MITKEAILEAAKLTEAKSYRYNGEVYKNLKELSKLATGKQVSEGNKYWEYELILPPSSKTGDQSVYDIPGNMAGTRTLYDITKSEFTKLKIPDITPANTIARYQQDYLSNILADMQFNRKVDWNGSVIKLNVAPTDFTKRIELAIKAGAKPPRGKLKVNSDRPRIT